MVSTFITLIPVAGGFLGVLLGFYSIILNVRALQAAHHMSVGAAIKVLIAPGVIFTVLCCLLIFLLPRSAGQ